MKKQPFVWHILGASVLVVAIAIAVMLSIKFYSKTVDMIVALFLTALITWRLLEMRRKWEKISWKDGIFFLMGVLLLCLHGLLALPSVIPVIVYCIFGFTIIVLTLWVWLWTKPKAMFSKPEPLPDGLREQLTSFGTVLDVFGNPLGSDWYAENLHIVEISHLPNNKRVLFFANLFTFEYLGWQGDRGWSKNPGITVTAYETVTRITCTTEQVKFCVAFVPPDNVAYCGCRVDGTPIQGLVDDVFTIATNQVFALLLDVSIKVPESEVLLHGFPLPMKEDE